MHYASLIPITCALALLAGCGGGGGGSSGGSSGGGGGTTTTITAADYNGRLVMLVANEDVGLRGFTEGGSAEDLSATELGATWAVASNTLVLTETQPDADTDGHNDEFRWVLTPSGSASTLTGTLRLTYEPGDVQTVSATGYRLPAIYTSGPAADTATTWEDHAGRRFTMSVGNGSGEGTITSSTFPGFVSGTCNAAGSYIYLRWSYLDGGATREGQLAAVRSTASTTVFSGVSVLGINGTITVSTSASLTAVPAGGG